MSLMAKKVLLIAPKSFGYEVEIKKKIEKQGAEVDYFDERPANTSFVKASIRLCRNLVRKSIIKYYEKIIQTNKIRQYDYIFFIHLETPFPFILEELINVNPNAQYILYMWDSFKHSPNALKLTKYFNKVYTFDRIDALTFNFNFLPLFYLDEYVNQTEEIENYDISFLGTIHSDRFFIVKELKKQAELFDLRSFWFLFTHNKLTFYKIKFSSKKNFSANLKEFSLKSMDKKSVVEILKKAKVIVDIQHPENNGLTMRTLEVLALNKKLITTNKDIVNYDFYDPQNIFIIDRKKPQISIDFIKTPHKFIASDIYKKYSIDFWVKSIFNIKV